MKYVVGSTVRPTGSAKESEEAVPRILELLSKWTPPASTTIHQWFTRIDSNGGFLVVETDNPADLAEATSAFGPFFDFQIHPVIDYADGVSAVQKGVEYRNSIS